MAVFLHSSLAVSHMSTFVVEIHFQYEKTVSIVLHTKSLNAAVHRLGFRLEPAFGPRSPTSLTLQWNAIKFLAVKGMANATVRV